ncbi:hypothetical protein D3C79_974820 [compost metagenome]
MLNSRVISTMTLVKGTSTLAIKTIAAIGALPEVASDTTPEKMVSSSRAPLA